MGNRVIYDTDTGEVDAELKPGDRVTIVRENSMAAYIKNREDIKGGNTDIAINEGEPFIKVYSKALFRLSRSLSGTESQFVNYLVQYIRYRSGILAYNNGTTLTRRHMMIETGLSERTIDKLLKSLDEKQVIGKHKTGGDVHYTVNPFIFMRGNKVNETLYTFYSNTHWAKESGK